MRKHRYRATLEKSLLAAAAIFLLAGFIALGFLRTLTKENRALIVILASVGMMACFVGLMSTNAFRKGLRRRTWRRAMSAWIEISQAGNPPKFSLARQLSDDELRHLAVQVYSRMGFIVINKDGGDDYVRMINPEGSIELVACKQQPNPVEIKKIYNLHHEMRKEGAVRGFFWSLEGFTSEAIYWARQKPIVLADQDEIGRLVDCAHENGSNLLER